MPHIIGLHLPEEARVGKPTEVESTFTAARIWGRGEWGVTINGYGFFFSRDDGKVLKLDSSDAFTTLNKL